jgi:hypothetical protein
MWQPSLTRRKLKRRTQNGDARTPPECIGDLDVVCVAQWMRPPISGPNDTASPECDSQARKLRTHTTNLLRRRELSGLVPQTRSRHGSYCEAWGPPLPLQGQYIP